MNVEPHLLERLMLDRALGQLSEDVEALLAAVVAEDAGRNSRQSELLTTAAQAHEAMKRRSVSAGLELPPLAARPRQRSRWRAAVMAIAMAGCLLVGLSARWLFPRERQLPAPEPSVVVVPAPTPAMRTSELWSLQAFIDTTKATQDRRKPLVNWHSPSEMQVREIEQ